MIRFLPALLTALLLAPLPLTAAEEEGFTSLFDGETLAGWQGQEGGYVVEEGAIVCVPSKGGFLYTEKEYADFILRFEFKLTEGANNGLGIRTPKGGDPAYVGMELQILDNESPKYKDKLAEYQYHGSVYGVVPAKRGFLKPAGEWNQQEVTVKGGHVKVVLNGETILDADVRKAAEGGTIDKRQHPGLERDKGYICFCGHGARVEFRALSIKEL